MSATADSSLATRPARRFRLWLYLLIVCGLSWPFQIIYTIIPFRSFGDAAYWVGIPWTSATMLMAAVGTFIAGRWVFRDGFRNAGWRWGNASSWALALGLPLLIIAAPAGLDLLTGARTLVSFNWNIVSLTLFVVVFGPILGFGEEFAWRGYLLPRQWCASAGPRRAVLVNGVIWWAWHLPVNFLPNIIDAPTKAAQLNLSTDAFLLTQVPVTLASTLVLNVILGFIFSYVWVRSGSIVVVSVLHGAFDAVRNITFYWLSPVGANSLFWLYIVFEVAIGLWLLWRGRWVLRTEANACD